MEAFHHWYTKTLSLALNHASCYTNLVCTCIHLFSLNILLDACLTAKLGDFGFAMDMPEHRSGRTLVSAPLIVIPRSDGYFAPKLIGRNISPKSDVYSLGVVSLL